MVAMPPWSEGRQATFDVFCLPPALNSRVSGLAPPGSHSGTLPVGPPTCGSKAEPSEQDGPHVDWPPVEDRKLLPPLSHRRATLYPDGAVAEYGDSRGLVVWFWKVEGRSRVTTGPHHPTHQVGRIPSSLLPPNSFIVLADTRAEWVADAASRSAFGWQTGDRARTATGPHGRVHAVRLEIGAVSAVHARGCAHIGCSRQRVRWVIAHRLSLPVRALFPHTPYAQRWARWARPL